jgi:predicted transcriptional regulator of viral defense system
VELGFAKSRLPQMAARGVAERVERGLYRFPAMPRTALDQYMQAVLWPHRAHDGIEAHIRHGLIEQAIETARRRGSIARAEPIDLERALSVYTN